MKSGPAGPIIVLGNEQLCKSGSASRFGCHKFVVLTDALASSRLANKFAFECIFPAKSALLESMLNVSEGPGWIGAELRGVDGSSTGEEAPDEVLRSSL